MAKRVDNQYVRVEETDEGVEITVKTPYVSRLSESQGFLGGKIVHYELPKTKDSPYIVDDSQFVPLSEALKQLDNVAGMSSDKASQFYDFVDGQDNGKEIPINRQLHEYNDVTEISNAIQDKVEAINQKASEINSAIQATQEFESKLGSTGKSE